MAAENNCLAQSNKSADGAKATKKRAKAQTSLLPAATNKCLAESNKSCMSGKATKKRETRQPTLYPRNASDETDNAALKFES